MEQREKIKELKERYIRRSERVEEIYEATRDKWVEPGYYEVIETDGGGMWDIPKFTFRVTKRINLKDLALELIEKRDYMSDWNYLSIRPVTENFPKVLTI